MRSYTNINIYTYNILFSLYIDTLSTGLSLYISVSIIIILSVCIYVLYICIHTPLCRLYDQWEQSNRRTQLRNPRFLYTKIAEVHRFRYRNSILLAVSWIWQRNLIINYFFWFSELSRSLFPFPTHLMYLHSLLGVVYLIFLILVEVLLFGFLRQVLVLIVLLYTYVCWYWSVRIYWFDYCLSVC